MLHAYINDNLLSFACLTGETILRPDENPFLKHFHNEYEFYFIMDGDVEYTIESAVYRLEPYDFLLIKPAQFHFLKLKTNKPYKRILINFSEKAVPDIMLPFLKTCGQFYRLGEKNEITGLLTRFTADINIYTKEEQALALRSLFHKLLLELKYTKAKTNVNTSGYTPFIEQAIQFINDNITDPLSAAAISKAVCLSESHLNHTFNAAFPITLMQYVRQKKMLLAQALIRSGVKPTDAALRCGYMQYATFYRAYKMTFKKSPQNDIS